MVRSYLPENVRIYMLFNIFQNLWLLVKLPYSNNIIYNAILSQLDLFRRKNENLFR